MQEILSTWRTSIEAELQTARAELSAATKTAAEAEIEVAEAKTARHALGDAVARLGPQPTVAAALHWRIRERDQALSQVNGKLVRARHEAATTTARIADLQAALEQIGRMMPVEIVMEEAAA